MSKDDGLTKVKIGDKPVASRFRYGGYSAGLTYEMSKEEAKAIVDRGLGNRVTGGKPPAVNRGESPERGVVNSQMATTESGKK